MPCNGWAMIGIAAHTNAPMAFHCDRSRWAAGTALWIIVKTYATP
jgi:hypothetical protein